MPAASFLPRTPVLAGAQLINISADVQLADGSASTVRIQGEDLLAYIAAKAAASGLPALDANGALVLPGPADVAVSTLSLDANGHLVIPLSLIPETDNGFVPVPGSNVIYTNGGLFKRA